jgi:hypothetical protein
MNTHRNPANSPLEARRRDTIAPSVWTSFKTRPLQINVRLPTRLPLSIRPLTIDIIHSISILSLTPNTRARHMRHLLLPYYISDFTLFTTQEHAFPRSHHCPNSVSNALHFHRLAYLLLPLHIGVVAYLQRLPSVQDAIPLLATRGPARL